MAFKKKASKARAGAKRPRMYDVPSTSARTPMPTPGEYLFEILSTEEPPPADATKAQTFQAGLKVIDSEGPDAMAEGSECVFLVPLNSYSGPGMVKAFFVAAAGCEDDDEFSEFDPDNEFIYSCLGYEENGMTEEHPDGVVGKRVRARVWFGNPVLDKKTKEPTGDHYREYEWAPHDDEASAEEPDTDDEEYDDEYDDEPEPPPEPPRRKKKAAKKRARR